MLNVWETCSAVLEPTSARHLAARVAQRVFFDAATPWKTRYTMVKAMDAGAMKQTKSRDCTVQKAAADPTHGSKSGVSL
jgi:hypothetical protein